MLPTMICPKSLNCSTPSWNPEECWPTTTTWLIIATLLFTLSAKLVVPRRRPYCPRIRLQHLAIEEEGHPLPSPLLKCGGPGGSRLADTASNCMAEVAFVVTAASFDGNLVLNSNNENNNNNNKLPLDRIDGLFPCSSQVKSQLLVLDDDISLFCVEVEFEGTITEQKNGLRPLSNFIIIKARVFDMNVSLKLYQNGYFQLHGFADDHNQFNKKARDLAYLFLKFMILELNEKGIPTSFDSNNLRLVSASAFHPGVSRLGARFNLDVLEKMYQHHFVLQASKYQLAKTSRNSRNHSLVVRIGKNSGSQIFHPTGSMQLFGVKDEPEKWMELLQQVMKLGGDDNGDDDNVIVLNEVVCAGNNKRKRKNGAGGEGENKRANNNNLDEMMMMTIIAEEDASLFNELADCLL